MKLRAYEKIVMALAEEIRRYLIGWHVAPEVAADIVQDMFVKVLEMALILAPDKLRPYLYRVAWSTYLDWYRREQRLQRLVTETLGPNLIESMPAHVIPDDGLIRAIQRLRPADRKLLVDRYYHQRALSLMVGAGGIQYIKVAAQRQTAQENRFFDLASQVMAPNIQSSDQYISNNGLVTTQLTSHRYKQIEGQRIPWSPMVATYSWWGGAPLPTRLNSLDGDRSSYDVVTQQKVPVFYNSHRRLSKEEPRQLAVQEVQQVARNRGYVAEVALSFEHPLTYQQIRQKLPVGVHPAWYWLGVTGDADTTLMDNNFLGIQAETTQGRLTTRGYQEFRQQLAQASRSGFSLTYGTFNVFQYASKYAKKHPTLATARFAGAIVTGESSRFKALDQAAWVEASSVGVFQRQQTIR